ncbi:hypothetical protein HanPSC8_Chr17g0787011 [Helianthus annuus]|nr:hypothetical protein HanPSC8_Chr17g0787011 [Helianthus annuus]
MNSSNGSGHHETYSGLNLGILRQIIKVYSFLANSTNGMRWPIPGLGTMAICAGFSIDIGEKELCACFGM